MSQEINKIAGAILTGGVVAMLSGFVAGKLYHPETLHEPAYKVALPDDGGAKPEKPKEESVLPLLAAANVEAGKKATQACAACHSFDQGGANKVGPNLWGIVDSEPASVAGYSFSPALEKLKTEGKKWTYTDLDHFLADPKDYAPGTKMTYNGIKQLGKRADVIAYLRTLSDSPAPLPTKEQIEAVTGSDETKTAAAATGGGEGTAAPSGGSGLDAMIAAASPEAGGKVARKCSACHTFDKGGANRVGPNLYDIIGEKAGVGDFKFSDAMAAKGQEGFTWTYQNLDDFLADPKKVVPGTKMAFPGVKKPEQRAELIAYMRTMDEDPPPLETKAGGSEEKKTEAPAADETKTAATTEEKSEGTASGEGEQKAEEPAADETKTAATSEEGAKEAATEPASDAPKSEETQTADTTGGQSGTEASTTESGQTAAAPPSGGSELDKMIAAADPEAGKKVARKCTACHTFDKGGKAKVGPNLYDIIGQKAGAVEGFKFSKAMVAKGDEGFTWSYQNLDDYLANPKKVVPGTKMTFPGLRKPEQRADVIAYMRTFSDDPPPLGTEAGGEGEKKTEAPAGDETQTAATTGDTSESTTADVSDEKAEAPASEEPAAGDTAGTETATSGGEQGDAGKEGDTQAAAAPPSGGSEIDKLIAAADPEKGAKIARKCTACHTFDKGGKTKIGPNLYDILGKKAGAVEGFKFSKAMVAKGDEGFTWTYQNLEDYLANPKKVIPGTKMTFPGLRKPEQRADVIAYMRTMAENPPPLSE